MKKGITLIEVLVTSLVLVIGVTGLMSTFVYCHRTIIQNTHRQNAVFIISEHLEGVQNRETASSVLDYVSNYADPKPVTAALNSGLDQDYLISMKMGPQIEPFPGTFLNIVTATVTWNGGGPNRTMSVSMLTNEPEI